MALSPDRPPLWLQVLRIFDKYKQPHPHWRMRDDLVGIAMDAEDAAREEERSKLSGGWEPIETAPRDGTWFLAHGNGDGWEGCSFVCEYDAIGGWREVPGDLAALPTCWMPLPALPQDHAPVRGREGSVDLQTASSTQCADPQAGRSGGDQ